MKAFNCWEEFSDLKVLFYVMILRFIVRPFFFFLEFKVGHSRC